MGKIKTVIMGDLEAEEAAKKKAEVKREQKKAAKGIEREAESVKTDEVKSKRLTLNAERYKFATGKKYAAAKSLVEKKGYSVSDAISLVKKTSYSKFDGSVEVHINVTEKNLRGSVTLPHSTGKQIKIAIASDELINSINSSSSINFDVLVATPAMMPKLAKIAKILGPKGLMPNPKTNTISNKPEELALSLSKSQTWKTQPDFPIVHAVIGKVSFKNSKLEENFTALIKSVGKDKIASVFIKATMSPSVRVQI